MVNYCCVYGCARNSRQSKHLNYYSLPKEKQRQVLWLKAAGREDLLQKDLDKLTHRFCSRHFPPSSIKNRRLCADAVPSLCLPGSLSEDDTEPDEKPVSHEGVVCNNCQSSIRGFRYKCVTCEDFDLCQTCEMHEAHPEHYMLRMPRPMNFKLADNLIKKWRKYFTTDHVVPECADSTSDLDLQTDSSDDEPITKYVTRYDSGIDLSEDTKSKIRDEVTKALKVKTTNNKKSNNKTLKIKKKDDSQSSVKRAGEEIVKVNKKPRTEDTKDVLTYMEVGDDMTTSDAPEVAFADVNEIKDETKQESLIETDNRMSPVMYVKLSDGVNGLTIEVTRNNS